jgi:hypothetical protein
VTTGLLLAVGLVGEAEDPVTVVVFEQALGVFLREEEDE